MASLPNLFDNLEEGRNKLFSQIILPTCSKVECVLEIQVACSRVSCRDEISVLVNNRWHWQKKNNNSKMTRAHSRWFVQAVFFFFRTGTRTYFQHQSALCILVPIHNRPDCLHALFEHALFGTRCGRLMWHWCSTSSKTSRASRRSFSSSARRNSIRCWRYVHFYRVRSLFT